MSTETVRYEQWPVWAKLIIIVLVIQVVLFTLPWIFLWMGMMGTNMMGMNMSQMSAACLAMMERMGGMMR